MFSNNNGETETPKSSEDDENNSEESSSDNNLVDSSNNQLIKWTVDDLMTRDLEESEEKIYEDLCYVTISSSFPSEVFIKLCYLICPPFPPASKKK